MNYFYIILFILLLALGYYLVTYYLKSHNTDKKKFIENNEYENIKKKTGNVYLFYTTWCPHCKTTIEKWDDINNKFSDERFKLNFMKIDCEKQPGLASKYNITEYPTIIMIIDGKKFIYDTNLEENTFIQFSNAVIESL